MLNSVTNLLVALLIPLAGFSVGTATLGRTDLRFDSTIERWVLGLGLGLGVLIYTMMLLGLVGVLRPWTAWLLVLAPLGLLPTIRPRADLVGAIREKAAHLRWPDLVLLAIGLSLAVGYQFTALAPTLEGDSLGGYLVLPREYATSGELYHVDWAYGALYPQNGQLLSTLGFLLGGQIVAQLAVAWVPGVLSAAAVFLLGRRLASERAGLVGAVVWYGTYSVGYVATSAKIDLAWAAFELLALLAFARWYFPHSDERDWRWLVVAGFLLGVAGGTKQASAFAAVALTGAVVAGLLLAGQRRPRSWLRSLLALGLPASLSLVWVARRWLLDGTLVYTGEKLRGAAGIAGFFTTLWDMSMAGNAVSLEGPLGKSVGPTILAAVPLLLLMRRVDRRVKHALVFAAAVVVMWFFGIQRARHLLPTLGLLAVVAGYVVHRLLRERPWLGRAAVALVALSLVLNLATWSWINFVSLERLPYVFGLQNRSEYLAANLPQMKWYPNHVVVQYARERLPSNARIAVLSTRSGYYVARPYYYGWSQTPEQLPDPGAFVARLREEGLTHVHTNEFVIEMRGWEDAWLARPEFRDRYLKRLVCEGGQCLFAVPQPDSSSSGRRWTPQ